jgi:hypothetical protein
VVYDPCVDDIKARREIGAIHLPCFSIGFIQNVFVVEAESGSLASSYQSLEFEIIRVGEVYRLRAIKKKKKKKMMSGFEAKWIGWIVVPFAAVSEKKKFSNIVGQWVGTSAERLLRFDSVANSRKIRDDGGHICEVAAEAVVDVGRMYY